MNKFVVRISSSSRNEINITDLLLIDSLGNECDLVDSFVLLKPSGLVNIRGYCPYYCGDLYKVVLQSTCGVYEDLDKERIGIRCEES